MRERIQSIIDAEVKSVPAAELTRAARDLTERYRAERAHSAPLIQSAAHRAAYLSVRMPATFAAVRSALERLRDAVPEFTPASCVDVGSGPGTATLAARDLFPSLRQCTLIERDAHMLQIARKLLDGEACSFTGVDVTSAEIPGADMIICAYTLNELTPSTTQRLIERAWISTRAALVIVEPGSRDGFNHVLSARRFFIDNKDGVIAAPCPAHMPCSLEQVGDWCHFSARVQRTSLHRRLKDASLGYEDEKFSYVIAVRNPLSVRQAATRIVRRPDKLKGHVKLQLCTIEGLQQTVVTKKNGSDYKRARDAQWGDAWPARAE